MPCGNCEKIIPPDVNYCAYCGTQNSRVMGRSPSSSCTCFCHIRELDCWYEALLIHRRGNQVLLSNRFSQACCPDYNLLVAEN